MVVVPVYNVPGTLVSDDFTGDVLDTSRWIFVNPVGDGSYSIDGGVLSISVPGGTDHDIWADGNRSARLIQSIDDTDFGIQVKFGSTPSQAFQSQGILIEQDAGNFLRFDILHNGTTLRVFGANFVDGTPTALFSKMISVSPAYFLRLSRTGDLFVMEYSLDAKEWNFGGAIDRALAVEHVGVFASNSSGSESPAFTAEVDYFFSTASPISPEDAGGPNTDPDLSIIGPVDGSTFVEDVEILLEALATDAEDGDISNSITWESDLDGPISGLGGSVPVTTLSIGTHVITASITDSALVSRSESITVSVVPNTPPVVLITSPENGTTFLDTDTIEFAATALDNEDGDIGLLLSWTSDLDGPLGEMGSIISTADLSIGTHLITASATDSGSFESSDSITVIVIPNETPTVTLNRGILARCSSL